MNYRSLLQKQGYICIPNVLSTEEVRTAREILIKIFAEKSEYEGDINQQAEIAKIYIDIFSRYKDLRWILFNPKMLEVLRGALGEDFIFIPETAIHDSGFGGWHKDTSSQEIAGQTFHWDDDFLMVQVGIYLQDNTAEYGGGLDVIPKSHKLSDRYAKKVKPTIGEKLRNKLFNLKLVSNPYQAVTLPTKAGDMVVFNLKLDHKATHPKIKPVPDKNRKLSIFMVCSVNNKHARAYTDYINSRPDYHYLKGHKYPEELLQEAKKHAINLMEV
jgi:hypothetical protein